MCDGGASAAAGGSAAASASAASVTTYMAILSAAMTAYGMYQQGQTQKDMNNYNADLQRVKAKDALDTGAIAEEKQRAHIRQIEGAQRAEMGGSGQIVGTGSFGEMLDQTAKFGELDALTIRANAAKGAWALNSQAEADTFMGKAAYQGGLYRGAGTLLSAGPDIYKGGKTANWWA